MIRGLAVPLRETTLKRSLRSLGVGGVFSRSANGRRGPGRTQSRRPWIREGGNSFFSIPPLGFSVRDQKIGGGKRNRQISYSQLCIPVLRRQIK